MCFFVPIVTFHLSPSNKTLSILWLYGRTHFWFHKCLNSNQILSLVCSGLSWLLHLFSDNQRETKSHLREGNRTNDDQHHHTRWLPKIFWLLLMFMPFVLTIKCPFSFIDLNTFFSSRLFISGSLKKFIGSFPFFSLFWGKWWTNNTTLSSSCLLFIVTQKRDKFHYSLFGRWNFIPSFYNEIN